MYIFKQGLKSVLIMGALSAIGLQQTSANNAFMLIDAKDTILASEPVKGIKIKGTVKAASTGKPLPGINITVFNYSSAFSDDNGHFEISVPGKNAALNIAGDGYQFKIVPVGSNSSIEIRLHESTYKSQYEIATLPYSKVSKSLIPYSVESVDLNGGWTLNSETSDSYLQGRVSGLNAVRRSGTPGIGANLFLRGYSSLSAGNHPLVIVDGVIYDTGENGSSIISGHMDNALSYIDPKDIDNITVIKDGGSLYGTKGANGVILISTIKAKEEATQIDFAAYGGINSKVKPLPVMGASDYRLYLSDLLQDRGWPVAMIDAQPYMQDDLAVNQEYYKYHNDTNWQDGVMENGINQNYYLKVSGGDDIATYGLSLGYMHNEGVLSNTFNNKYHVRFNGDLKLTQKLGGIVNLSFLNSDQDIRDGGRAYSTNPLYLATIKAPFLSVNEIDNSGVQSPNLSDRDIFNISNPLVALNNAIGKNRNYRFLGSVGFNYAFNKRLNLTSQVGVTYNKVRESFFIPEKGISRDSLSTAAITNRSGTNVGRLLSIYNDTRLSYNKSFGSVSDLAANVGFRYNNRDAESDYGYGYNSATDDLITVTEGAAALRQIGGSIGKSRWMNMYLNADYKHLNRYFLSFNMALDGSSRFGKEAEGGISIGENKFAVMPSLAAGWLLSSEEFMGSQNWIDLLKLRASYSITGNDNIGNYSARRYYISQNLLGMQGLIVGNIGNPGLKWETVYKVNIGADIAILNERLNLSLDIYEHTTKDMLTWRNVNTSVGLKNALTNEGEMFTKGAELGINARLVNRTFKWDMGLNISTFRNEIVAIPGNSILSSFGGATILTEVGRPANVFYGYKTDGVFSTEAEAVTANQYTVLFDGSIKRYAGGDVRFVNVRDSEEDIAEGRKYINEDDMQVIGDPNPDFTGMFSNLFSWKRWSMNTQFTFSSGNDIYNGTRAALESQSGVQNQTIHVVNRWRNEGQETDVPRASWGDPMGNARFSDRWIEDGSYLRLRTLSLSYDLPIKGKKLLKNATIYGTVNNVFTLTKYKGFDPEFSATSSVIGQGVDTGLQPLFRSTQLGIRIGL